MRQHNARKMTLTKTIAAIATSVAVSGSTLIGAPAASAQPAAPKKKRVFLAPDSFASDDDEVTV